jgi:UDP-GlcNAc:undecaprenyl-phosphate GlcNAc-1-phosphate transferase
MINYIGAFLVTAVLSCILTFIVRRVSVRYGLLSLPRRRDVHSQPMPRIGGLAIFCSFMVVSLVIFLLSGSLTIDIKLVGIWIASTVITLAMFADDIFGMTAKKKLLFQIFVALIVIASGIGIDTLANPFGAEFNLNAIYIPVFKFNGIIYHFSLISDLLTLVWLVGMMNVINFIDGVDGLAGGVSAISAATIFLLCVSPMVNQPEIAYIAIILSGAAAGFLIWNFPPAKIFMGDSGSMFLGFMLGVLPLISGGKLATAFLVLGFPIIDGLFVFFSRLAKRQNPMTTPDKTHLHHRFIAAGFSTRNAVLSLYFISALFGWVALRSTTINKIYASLSLVFLIIVLIILLEILRTKKRK